MKDYERIEAAINQAHQETTNPVVALIAAGDADRRLPSDHRHRYDYS